MVEFRYKREKVSDQKALEIGESLEDIIRSVISRVRPDKKEFGITVEGDPFGPIAFNQPDLRIYCFYHQEWNFSAEELSQLALLTAVGLKRLLHKTGIADINAVVRLYARAGHAAAKTL